jgi:hypothetical protein
MQKKTETTLPAATSNNSSAKLPFRHWLPWQEKLTSIQALVTGAVVFHTIRHQLPGVPEAQRVGQETGTEQRTIADADVEALLNAHL